MEHNSSNSSRNGSTSGGSGCGSIANGNVSASGRPLKPSRLRDACNQCHLAKVKCSGDKTGCRRCSQNSLACEYSVSRAGKNPGRRGKRAPDLVTGASMSSGEGGVQSPQQSTQQNLPKVASSDLRRPDISEIPSHKQNIDDISVNESAFSVIDSMQPNSEWSDLGFGNYEALTPETMDASSDTMNHLADSNRMAVDSVTASSLTPGMVATLDWTNDVMNQQYYSYNNSMDSSTEPSPPPSQQTSAAATVNSISYRSHGEESQYVQVCCQIIESLQEYLAAELKVIDLILITVAKTITRLTEIFFDELGNGIFPRMHCRVLLLTCVLQLIELLKMGCAPLMEDMAGAGNGTGGAGGTAGRPRLDRRESSGSQLDFGGLNFNEGERRARKAQKVLHELATIRAKLLVILEQVKVPDAQGPCHDINKNACDAIRQLDKIIHGIKRKMSRG